MEKGIENGERNLPDEGTARSDTNSEANGTYQQGRTDYGIPAKGTKYGAHTKVIIVAVIIAIIAIVAIFEISALNVSKPSVTTSVAVTTGITAPDYLNTTLAFSSYYLSTEIYSNSAPFSAIYAYVNKHSKLGSYSASYNESYTVNGINYSEAIKLQRNGSDMEIGMFNINSSGISAVPIVYLYAVNSTYYWCVESVPCIILNKLSSPLDNLSKIDSISFAAHQINPNVTVKEDYINVLNAKNASYKGISCKQYSGNFEYTASNGVAPYNLAGNFSECMSSYGIPLYFSVNGAYGTSRYSMALNETSFSTSASGIAKP